MPPLYYQPQHHQTLPPKKKWLTPHELLMIEATAPMSKMPVSICDAFCDQQTKFGMVHHFLPALAKRFDESNSNKSDHSLTERPPEDFGISKENEIEE